VADLGTTIIAAAAGLSGAVIGAFASRGAAKQQAKASMQVATAKNVEDRQTWLKNRRVDVYAQFVTAAQKLLRLCEQLLDAADQGSSSIVSRREQEGAYYELVAQNALVQILASEDGEVINATHDVMDETRRLWTECRDLLSDRGTQDISSEVVRLEKRTLEIRKLRHKAISAMADELGTSKSADREETLDNLAPGSRP
jgi:hypothetical protein